MGILYYLLVFMTFIFVELGELAYTVRAADPKQDSISENFLASDGQILILFLLYNDYLNRLFAGLNNIIFYKTI